LPPTPIRPDAPAEPQPNSAGTVLFQDSFDSSASDTNWTAVDINGLPPGAEPARWGTMDGMLRQLWTGEHYAARPDPTMAVAGKLDWTDYIFTASAYPESNIEMGVIFRRQGNSFYRFRVINKNYNNKDKILLEKIVDDKVTVLAALPGPGYTDHRWYTFRVTVKGAHIEATFDDTLKLAADDASLTKGQIGLYGFAIGDLGFDNVSVVVP
jgi:hypothetical protein